MDEYYQAARSLCKMNRQDLANELGKLHQQTIEEVVEYVLNLVGDAEREGWTHQELREQISRTKISSTQLAHDKVVLRRIEAIMYVLRDRKALLVSKKLVAEAFERGDGVDVTSSNPTMLEIETQVGKFRGL